MDGFFEAKDAGGRGGKWPASVVLLSYETGAITGSMVVYAGGTIAKKISIPKRKDSEKIIEEISAELARPKA